MPRSITVLLSLVLISQAWLIGRIGNGLSPWGDHYSEANAFRAAKHYSEHGFFVDAGLPHITYGGQFPEDGNVQGVTLSRGVYTRYPPLPDIICGLLETTIGSGNRWLWRFLPVALGLFALAFAFRRLAVALGPGRAATVTWLIGVAPATWLFMSSLHFQSYAHSLLIIELSLLADILLTGRKPHRTELVLLGVLGFLQGWLSFDYWLPVSLSALPLAILAIGSGTRVQRAHLLGLIAAPSVAFVAAHGLHLLQVAAFYGELSTAIADLGGRAGFRMTGGTLVQQPQVLLILSAIIQSFRAGFVSPVGHFAPIGSLVLVLALVLPLVRRTPWNSSRLLWFTGGAIAVALAVAMAWMAIMPVHSLIHLHFVPRILLVPYFTALVASAIWIRPVAPVG